MSFLLLQGLPGPVGPVGAAGLSGEKVTLCFCSVELL